MTGYARSIRDPLGAVVHLSASTGVHFPFVIHFRFTIHHFDYHFKHSLGLCHAQVDIEENSPTHITPINTVGSSI